MQLHCFENQDDLPPCEAEALALQALECMREEDPDGEWNLAREVIQSLKKDPSQFACIYDYGAFSAVLGRRYGGVSFWMPRSLSDCSFIYRYKYDCRYHLDEIADDITPVGITYYFLCKTIQDGKGDPQMNKYRMAVENTYRKCMHYFMAKADGKDYGNYEFGFEFFSDMYRYDHNLDLILMTEMIIEPGIGDIDSEVNEFYSDLRGKYDITDENTLVSSGKKYVDTIFRYLESNIRHRNIFF